MRDAAEAMQHPQRRSPLDAGFQRHEGQQGERQQQQLVGGSIRSLQNIRDACDFPRRVAGEVERGP